MQDIEKHLVTAYAVAVEADGVHLLVPKQGGGTVSLVFAFNIVNGVTAVLDAAARSEPDIDNVIRLRSRRHE